MLQPWPDSQHEIKTGIVPLQIHVVPIIIIIIGVVLDDRQVCIHPRAQQPGEPQSPVALLTFDGEHGN